MLCFESWENTRAATRALKMEGTREHCNEHARVAIPLYTISTYQHIHIKWSVIFQAGFPHIYKFTATPWFVCLVYSLPSNIFYWVLFSFYRTPEDRTKLPLNLRSWKNDLSQTNCLGFVVFLMYNFHLSLAGCIISSGDEKIIQFLLFELFYVCFSPLFSGVFLNVICYSIKKNGNSVVVGFVLSSEVKN